MNGNDRYERDYRRERARRDGVSTDDDEHYMLVPRTRRWIIVALTIIATMCIITEAMLVYLGHNPSAALVSVAATAVGGIAGIALPTRH